MQMQTWIVELTTGQTVEVTAQELNCDNNRALEFVNKNPEERYTVVAIFARDQWLNAQAKDAPVVWHEPLSVPEKPFSGTPFA